MTENLMTTTMGAPVDNDQDSLTAGEYGPILIQDFHLIDKLSKFDRERIPERVVHAKGTGAHGYLEVTHDVSKFCRADIFKHVGAKTPMFIRFSTVIGEQASADSERDPRGFAIKFTPGKEIGISLAITLQFSLSETPSSSQILFMPLSGIRARALKAPTTSGISSL